MVIFLCTLFVQEAQAGVPAWQATSAIAASTGADVTVTLPAHQENDIFLIAVVVRDQDDTITWPSGWTQIATVDRSTVSRYWWAWKRAASSSETNPLVDKSTATGDTYATVITFRGALATGDPWEVKGTAATGTTDPAVLTGITTLTPSSLVVAALGGEDDNNASVSWTATDPATLTDRYTESSTGSDGMVDFGHGVRTTPGATGNVSGNFNSANPVGWGGIVLALKPPTQVYYSVGQNTSDHKTGSPTITIASGVATFSVAQTATNMGVGDRVTYNGSTVAYISGKISSTQWRLVTVTGDTPPGVSSAQTVNSIAHEFTSLSVALPFDSSGAKALLGTSDLVTGNYVLNIPCYNDAGAADTTTVTIDFWTVDATHYIRVYTPSNTSTECNQSQRHSGKWDDTKYRMLFSSGWIQTYYAISLRRPIKFEGIQFAIDPDADDRIIVNVYWDDGGHDYIFNSCIFKSLDTDGTYYAKAIRQGTHSISSAINFRIYNCIFYDFVKTTYGFGIEAQGDCVDNFYIYNCTFHNNYTAVSRLGGTVVMKNCLFTGNTTADASGTFAAGTDYNATDRASIGYTVSGSGNTHDRVSQTFSFVNGGSDDFHLTSNDAGAKDHGVDLSGDTNIAFSTDIDGQGRPCGSAWDIGADEAQAAAVYYSVGQNTNDHKTGSPTITISSGVATFSVAQTATNMGVGDKVAYTTAPQTDSYSTGGTYTWTCPAGVTSVTLECWGAGGGGSTRTTTGSGGGGGGGAYSKRNTIPVTPGTGYTVTVGSGGGPVNNGGDSTFTGDSSTTCLVSISTVLEMTNGTADLGEADDKLLVAEPRHGCWGVGKS